MCGKIETPIDKEVFLMSNEQQRHDISDKVWDLLEPHLPGQRGQWGGIENDNR